MGIKSLDELKALREKNKGKVSLRHGGNYKGEQTEILVGMGTCGIASGARETLNAITEEIEKHSLENIRVVPVGCIGYCQYEPILMIHEPEKKSYAYGKVTKDLVPGIIQSHLIDKKPVEHMLINIDFDRA